MRSRRGQVLVELALALPLILLILLGGLEAATLLITKAHQDRATATVAAYAAGRPDDESWHSVAERELPGCDVTIDEPQPGLIEATATCHYSPRILPGWGGLPMTSRESATRSQPVLPAPSPSASPGASSS
jgi:hypothetical protein